MNKNVPQQLKRNVQLSMNNNAKLLMKPRMSKSAAVLQKNSAGLFPANHAKQSGSQFVEETEVVEIGEVGERAEERGPLEQSKP